MAELTLQDGSAGIANIAFAAAAVGDQIASGTRAAGWDLGIVLLVKNASISASRTVTVEGHPAIVVPISGQGIVPAYRQKYGSLKTITYSAVADLTVAAVRLTPVEPVE